MGFSRILNGFYGTAIALAADYTNLLQLLESSDELTPEMITDTLEGIEGELADKLDAIMVIARNNLGHAKTCDEEIKRLAERKKSFENKDKTLRKYILSCLLAANLDKLKTPKNSFTARKGSVSVVIDNEKLLPDELVTVRRLLLRTKKPSKKRLRLRNRQLDYTFHDIKAKAISDFEGSSRDKQIFSGHKTESQVLIYDRKVQISPTLDLPLI